MFIYSDSKINIIATKYVFFSYVVGKSLLYLFFIHSRTYMYLKIVHSRIDFFFQKLNHFLSFNSVVLTLMFSTTVDNLNM